LKQKPIRKEMVKMRNMEGMQSSMQNGIGGKNLPEKKFRAGAISATVWSNHGQSKSGEENTYNTISLERSYKDKNDKWQTTGSLRLHDLPKAALLLDKAYEYLVLQNKEVTAE
jgi:hypothetical protein